MDILPIANSLVLLSAGAYYAKRRLGEKRAKKRLRQFYGSDVDAVIHARLSQVRFEFDADKAKIFQFHNGGVFINGHSMKKMSLSYIQVKPGVTPPNTSRLQQLPVSFFPNMMSRFLKGKGVIVWNAKDAPDAFIRTRHIEEQVEQVMLASIWSTENNLIGFVSLNWIDSRAVRIDEPTLVKFADEIGELLSSY